MKIGNRELAINKTLDFRISLLCQKDYELYNPLYDARILKPVFEPVMQANIVDFSDWRDDIKLSDTFNKLIDGPELFYEKQFMVFRHLPRR